MTLLEALALPFPPAPVIAFVGGGGKTSALFRLATDLVAAGGRVITTTTTQLAAAQLALAPSHLRPADASPDRIAAILAQSRHLLITEETDPATGKAKGVPTAFVSTIAQAGLAAAILVEADGSRKRPFKAPAAYEPVIPAESTLVVLVVGVDVFGRPLDESHVHRPALVSALSGCPLGAPVTPQVVAGVLTHAQGGQKGIPVGARVAVLLNKVDLLRDWTSAYATVDLLRNQPAIDCILLGAMQRPAHEAVYERFCGKRPS